MIYNVLKITLIAMIPLLISCSFIESSSKVSRDKAEYYINIMEVSILSLELWSLTPSAVNETLAKELLTSLKSSVLDVQKLGENVHKTDMQRVARLFIRMQMVAKKFGKKNIDELLAAYHVPSQ